MSKEMQLFNNFDDDYIIEFEKNRHPSKKEIDF